MAVSASERRFLLDQVDRLARADLNNLWAVAEQLGTGAFFDYILSGFPELASNYHQVAATVAATWFEQSDPQSTFIARPADPVDEARIVGSTRWALGGDGVAGRDRLEGVLQRAVFDGARDTVIVNAEASGSTWIRVARPDACAFCRLLASRTALSDDLYRSEESALGVVGRSVNLSIADRRMIAQGLMTREEALARRDQMQLTYQIGRRKGSPRGKRLRGARKYGDKYHDDCRCTAKAIPAGRDPMEVLFADEPEYAFSAEQWNNEYIKARQAADSGDPKAILSAWRKLGDDIA